MESWLPLHSTAGAPTSQQGWISSSTFDLAFFVLSPLAGLLVVVGQLYTPLGIAAPVAATYLIGLPHYLSSFSFFLGDENRAYYKTRLVTFVAGPLLIVIAVIALRLIEYVYLIGAIIYVWNIYHVAAQSAGILSIYRRLSGAVSNERVWAHRAILFVNATMAFWFLDRYVPLYDPLTALHSDLPLWLRYACLAAAAYYGIGYAIALGRRASPMSNPERMFLATSLLLFCPYLWVEDSALATLAMLTGHFIQYLGIVWLLNRRKFVPAHGSRRQQWLGHISGSLPSLVITLLGAGTVFLALDIGSRAINAVTWYTILFNSLALIHFYIDGLIWAFRNPFVQRTVGPFVALECNRVQR